MVFDKKIMGIIEITNNLQQFGASWRGDSELLEILFCGSVILGAFGAPESSGPTAQSFPNLGDPLLESYRGWGPKNRKNQDFH